MAMPEKVSKKTGAKVLKVTGVVCADILAFCIFAFMAVWVIAFAGMTLAVVGAGLRVIFNPLFPQLAFAPDMPYFGYLLTGISVIGLGGLLAVVALYSYRFLRGAWAAYRRWRKNALDNKKYPPVPVFPLIASDGKRRKIRGLVVISAFVFGGALIIGYIYLAISAGGFQFWHVWNWFQ